MARFRLIPREEKFYSDFMKMADQLRAELGGRPVIHRHAVGLLTPQHGQPLGVGGRILGQWTSRLPLTIG